VAGENVLPQGMSWANCVPGPSITPSRDFDISKCVAVASYYILYTPTALILWLGGQVLNGSVNYALDGKTFNSDMISNGWAISRDVANLFFIFILLYIAIATILQLSGYGMKDLLVKIIIIALLVNFSLLICKVIIDASNILALQFYQNMTIQGGTVTTGLFGSNARDISAAFLEGFNPQKLLSTQNFENWQAAGGVTVVVGVIVMFLLGSIMNIVSAFILFAGAVLFVIRIAVLWLIMLLAPLAFLAMVLPATKQYASEWWNKLFKQAFFAPAFLFLFFLVVKIIYPGQGKTGILDSMFGSLAQNTANLNGINGFFASIITILIYFTIMAVLMIACLIVAQKMGAYGAGTVMKWGKDAKKWGQGYAGKISKRGAGYVAEKALQRAENKPEGRVSGALKTIPGLTRGLAKASSWREQQKKEKEKKYVKQYGSYSDAALSQMTKNKFGAGDFVGLEPNISGPLITEAKKKAIDKILLDRTINKERGKTEKEREIDFEGGKMKVGDAEKLILSLRKEVATRGDNAEAAQKRLTELVLQTAKTKKKHKDEYGGEDNLKKEVDALKAQAEERGSKPPPEKTT
jgi:hypothetical protein